MGPPLLLFILSRLSLVEPISLISRCREAAVSERKLTHKPRHTTPAQQQMAHGKSLRLADEDEYLNTQEPESHCSHQIMLCICLNRQIFANKEVTLVSKFLFSL